MTKKIHRASFWKLSLWMYLFATGTSFALPANTLTLLTFEGAGNINIVGDYYNGGAGGDYGIHFSDNSLSLVSWTAGGSGNFTNSASMGTLLFFFDGSASTMDVIGGFDTGFSFYYASATSNAFYSVYSGLDGTGTLLASGVLDNTAYSQGGYDTSQNQVGVTFDGVAQSVLFGGAANYVAFDNITLGSDHAVFGARSFFAAAVTDIDTAIPFYLASNLGTTVNPVFTGGTLRVDQANSYFDDFTVDASGTNTIDHGGLDATFSGVFSDAIGVSGHLNIANSGTSGSVTFTGENTYTGGTTINTGATLALGDGGTTGSVVGDVGNEGTLVFNRSDDVTFDGVISGAGGLEQFAPSLLILTADNTYQGGTGIDPGSALQLGNGGTTGSIVGDVGNEGTLVFNRSDDVTFAGVISGAGGLKQAGTGEVILTAHNTYTGGTWIDSGSTLQLGNGSTTGCIVGDIANDGALIFNCANDVAFGGVISGTGELVIRTSQVVLTADNTYTGGTTINPGSGLLLSFGGTTGSIVGNVTDNGWLIFIRPDDVTFASVISGAGWLDQIGNGTLALTGNNTFTGGTWIRAGSTLQLGNGGTTGSIVSDVANDGALVFNRSDAATFGGVVADAGTLTQAGTGTLTLTGTNTYTGGTTINSGATLVLGARGTTGSIVGDVTDNGYLFFTRSNAVTFGGVVSGTGQLRQTGTGTLTLTGTNAYTGGTTINTGAALVLGAGGTTGSIVGNVTDNGALAFNRSTAVTFGGIVSGAGTLTQVGTGTLTLTGTNTYTGGTAINNGAIAIGADANLGAANGLLAISGGSLQLTSNVSTARPIGIGSSGGTINTGASQLSTTGILIGPGNLTLQGGTGSWNLGGNASAYTGSFRVAQGTLYLNTALGASQLTVSPGATLRGTGLLAGALSVQGQLNPGNSPGTLSVVGPVSFAAGSTATFEIDGTGTGSGAGNYSRLVSSSSITLNGGMVVPVLRGLSGSASNTFVPSLAQRFNVMAGAGGITGAFAGLTQPAAGLPTGLTFDLAYGSNSVDLIFTPADFGKIADLGISFTPARVSTGAALQALRPAAGARPVGDVAVIYPALFSLDTAGLTTALDQIGTNVYGQLLEGALTDRSELMATVARHQPHRDPFWFDTTAGRDFAPGDGLSRGYVQTNLGAMVGCDLWRTAPWLAGVAIQKQAGRLSSYGADRAYAKLDEMGGLAYARYTQGPWQFNLDGETSRTAAEVSRTIAFGGLALRALGQPVVNTASLSATLSRDYQRAGFLIQPSVGLTYGTAWAHAFTETGANPLSLHVHSVSDERAATLLAVDLSRRLLGARHPLLLSVNLGYEHQLNTTGAESRVNLTASGSPIFILRSQRPAADLLRLRGLAAFTLGENAEAYLSAQNTALSQKQTGYSLRGGLNLHF